MPNIYIMFLLCYFHRMQAELESSYNLFRSQSLMLLISKNNDSQGTIDENIVKIANSSFFRWLCLSRIKFCFHNFIIAMPKLFCRLPVMDMCRWFIMPALLHYEVALSHSDIKSLSCILGFIYNCIRSFLITIRKYYNYRLIYSKILLYWYCSKAE